MTKLNVALIGQAAFGKSVFEALNEKLSEHINIVLVSAPKTSRGDALWTAASDAGKKVLETKTLASDPEVLSVWESQEIDLCLLAFVTDILPSQVFSHPKLGCLQYHPSLLPLHRGLSSIAWTIINQDEEAGLSIFWVDRYIDHGPICVQKRVKVEPNDTVKSLYFGKLFPLGVEAMIEAVELVLKDPENAPREKQDHKLATYEPPCDDTIARLPLRHDTAERIFALVRGCNPAPGAYTLYEEKKLRFFDSTLEEPVIGLTGRVLSVDESGFRVRLNGGVLNVQRVSYDGGAKLSAGEWAASVGLKKGFRFP